jgi:hypothetical protein
MRKLISLSIALAAGCGAGAFKDQARDALPDSGGVQMKTPSSGASGSQLHSSIDPAQQTLATASDWYKVTVAYAVSVNLATAWTLGIVEAVTGTEPTSCTADSCTWGPGSDALDPLRYKLVVTKNGDTFDWELDAQPKSPAGSPFVKIIYGNAVPSGIRHRGSGNFTIDLDAAATLPNHSTDQGKIRIKYSNVGPPSVEAHFDGVKDSNPNHTGQIGNAYYNYQQDASGGGDLEIAWHNLTSNERDDIHSRWKVDGSGRSDVTLVPTNGSLQFSECWDTAVNGFVTTFNASVGTEAACSILGAQFGSHINDAP